MTTKEEMKHRRVVVTRMASRTCCRWWKRISTNLLERAFQESRRRTEVIPHFLTERACLKLVFSALWKTCQRWRGIKTTELERQQLALLRQELGLPLYPGQETHVRR